MSSEGRKFTIYWVCDEHRVPLELSQVSGGGDTWHVFGGDTCIINLIPSQHGNLLYTGDEFFADDIRAIVDIIKELTGESFNEILFYPDPNPMNVRRFPPYFRPVFRDKRQEINFYRNKLKSAEKDLASLKQSKVLK